MNSSILQTISSRRRRYGLESGTLLRMMKAALPPTIAVAMYDPRQALSRVGANVL